MKVSYLNDAFFSRLETLALNLRTDLSGYFGGKHLVKTYGQTVEFADYREYQLGDDIRRIDWNLYSRFEKYFLKLFTDERQMQIQIFLDCSASMGKENPKKAAYAIATAAALGFLSVHNMDKVSYKLMRENRSEDPFGTIVGKNAFFRAISELENTEFSEETDLEAAITENTRLLILNTPSNPTGAVYRRETLEKIAEIAVRRNIMILADEIYEKLTYDADKPHVSIASLSDEVNEHVVTVNGFSKTYAMTGWRLGYLRAPRWLARRIIAFQSHTTSNPTTFAQYGAIAALEGKADKEVRHMCEEFAKRRDLVYELISAIPGVKCIRPQGAFYLLCDVSSFGMTSEEFCNRLLAEEKLAAIPCCSFGAEGQIRLSYACSEENIRDAAGRLDAFCREHGN